MKKSISIILAILMCFSCFSIISFAETTDSEHLTSVPEGYVGIYTKDDLDNIKLDLSGKYILMNDIVFTEEDYAEGGSFYNSGKGWEPIGTISTPFKGTFDGNCYSIVNLQINNPNETHQGLFGYIYTATVKRLTLANANIIGGSYIGGIIGEAEYGSKINNCIFSGIVQGENCVGGIAGQVTVWGNAYGYYSSITVEKCANTGTINGVRQVGGIVGFTQSYSSYNYGATYVYVKNCFNAGRIYATDIAAGISCDTGFTKVQNCLSVEEVSAKDASPITNDGTTTSCYYLAETATNYTGTYGTAKSADQLKKQSTFAQWDFDTVWTMEGRDDYPYPELRDVPLIFPDELNHEHEYSSEITTPATHLTEGLMTFNCACGDTYTEVITKTTEHAYNTVVTAPTCTEKGYTTYTCECGDTYVADFVEANGHSHTAVVTTPATHLTEGIMTYTCTCGDTYTETIAKTTEHSFKEEILATPTCTENGEKLFTCECGYSYTEETAKTNHINTNGDFACDECETILCAHMCHKSGFMGFIWKIINFFWKLFGMNPVCVCGAAHY